MSNIYIYDVITAERGRGRHSELKESERALCYRWPTGTKLQYPALTVSDAFSLGSRFNSQFRVSGPFWLPDMRSYPVYVKLTLDLIVSLLWFHGNTLPLRCYFLLKKDFASSFTDTGVFS